MIKPAYSVSFQLSINIFVWQNVLYFLDASRIYPTVAETGTGSGDNSHVGEVAEDSL